MPGSKDDTSGHILDLRSGGDRPGNIGLLYDRIASELRSPYAEWIGDLGHDTGDSLDWWLESPATRNPVFSALYHQLVSLMVLKEGVTSGHAPGQVLVDSPAMAAAVRRLLPGNRTRIVGPGIGRRLTTGLRRILSPPRSMVRLMREWRAARSRGWIPPDLPPRPILVDTFAIPGYVEKDRYYPGMRELAGEAAERVLFVPQFFNMKPSDIRRAAVQLTEKHYLIKERWLGWSDMLWCFGHLFRLRRTLPESAVFRGLELRDLLREDIYRRLGFRCAVRGLMNYRFAMALGRAGVKPALIIDWFENHPMDRGWNAGFNLSFGDTPRFGYTGFFPAGMSYRPTSAEKRAGVLPPRFLLIGEGFSQDMAEFLPDIRYRTAPAFRYPLWPRDTMEGHIATSTQTLDILVAMPYYEKMCQTVLEVVSYLQAHRPNWRFVIKAHPAMPLSRFAEAEPLLAGGAVETDDSLDTRLPRCVAMVTGSQASTILESAALGIPAVIVHRTGSEAEVSIPRVMPAELVRVCHNGKDALDALDDLTSNRSSGDSTSSALGFELQRRCFTPVTQETVAAMLAA